MLNMQFLLSVFVVTVICVVVVDLTLNDRYRRVKNTMPRRSYKNVRKHTGIVIRPRD